MKLNLHLSVVICLISAAFGVSQIRRDSPNPNSGVHHLPDGETEFLGPGPERSFLTHPPGIGFHHGHRLPPPPPSPSPAIGPHGLRPPSPPQPPAPGL